MKDKMTPAYMQCAKAFASLSYAIRKKVGGVAITPNDVMLYSWNGTASGDDNNCEDKVYLKDDEVAARNDYTFEFYKAGNKASCPDWLNDYLIKRNKEWPYEDEIGRYKLLTKPTTLHSERNIIAKAAKEGISLKDSTFVVTMSPCLECSVQLVQSGVRRVIYEEEYRDLAGIEYLKSHGVQLERVE